MVRAKFKVNGYETRLDRGEELRTIKMSPVIDGSDENKKFFRYTPFGSIELGTINQAAWEQFPLGEEIYCDFTSAKLAQSDVSSKA